MINLYGKRFTIEETFRDEKDLHFGLGLSATHSCLRSSRSRGITRASPLGAFLGVHVIAGDPGRFPIAVLGEGGYMWTADHAARFARGGGKRVFFVCSTGACNASTSPLVTLLRRAGVEAKRVSAGNIGHLVDDRIVQRVREEWPWVLRGDGERAAD